ncbi:unnamed protein product [Citrullus colocynthis]|uniref:Uncharacterized protein n=1 Tax=Citrullus colocynthis TaxID=252529 RepID=A0ABP0YM72_9ROSI
MRKVIRTHTCPSRLIGQLKTRSFLQDYDAARSARYRTGKLRAGTVAARMEIANASAGVTLGDGSLARASNGLAALLASALLNNQRLAQARRSLTFKPAGFGQLLPISAEL